MFEIHTPAINPKLRFNIEDVRNISGRYAYGETDNELHEIKRNIENHGYLSQSDLQRVAQWKAPRSAGNVNKNPDDYVR